jgi:hypothetical protein
MRSASIRVNRRDRPGEGRPILHFAEWLFVAARLQTPALAAAFWERTVFEEIQSTLIFAKAITFAHFSAALAISAPN